MIRLVTLAAALAPLVGAAQVVTSTFDVDIEGWTRFNDATVAWSPTGLPAGSLRLGDYGTGQYYYFQAPTKFLGDQSAKYGGALRYDLFTNNVTTSGESQPDLSLIGGGLTVVLNLANPVANAWTPYSVSIVAGAWRLDNYSGALATEAQMRTVLGALTALRIRGEFSPSIDYSLLDNVVFAGAGTPVAGVVQLQAFVPGEAGRSVVFEVLQNGATVETHTVTLGAGGAYTFETSVSGAAQIAVKAAHWLRDVGAPTVVVPGVPVAYSASLINGDCDDDNDVDIDDYDVLASAYGSAPATNPMADLDGDDDVDIDDYDILADEYGSIGD